MRQVTECVECGVTKPFGEFVYGQEPVCTDCHEVIMKKLTKRSDKKETTSTEESAIF